VYVYVVVCVYVYGGVCVCACGCSADDMGWRAHVHLVLSLRLSPSRSCFAIWCVRMRFPPSCSLYLLMVMCVDVDDSADEEINMISIVMAIHRLPTIVVYVCRHCAPQLSKLLLYDKHRTWAVYQRCADVCVYGCVCV